MTERRAGEHPMVLYRVLRWTMSFYFRARMKIRFEGEDNVPEKGPFFLVLSHQSDLDSLLLHTFCPRLIFTLAKSSVFRTRLMGWLAPRVAVIKLTHSPSGWCSASSREERVWASSPRGSVPGTVTCSR